MIVSHSNLQKFHSLSYYFPFISSVFMLSFIKASLCYQNDSQSSIYPLMFETKYLFVKKEMESPRIDYYQIHDIIISDDKHIK